MERDLMKWTRPPAGGDLADTANENEQVQGPNWWPKAGADDQTQVQEKNAKSSVLVKESRLSYNLGCNIHSSEIFNYSTANASNKQALALLTVMNKF